MKKLKYIVVSLLLGSMLLSGQTPVRSIVRDSCRTAGGKDSLGILKQIGKDSAMIVSRLLKINCFGGHKPCDSIRTDTFTLEPMRKITIDVK